MLKTSPKREGKHTYDLRKTINICTIIEVFSWNFACFRLKCLSLINKRQGEKHQALCNYCFRVWNAKSTIISLDCRRGFHFTSKSRGPGRNLALKICHRPHHISGVYALCIKESVIHWADVLRFNNQLRRRLRRRTYNGRFEREPINHHRFAETTVRLLYAAFISNRLFGLSGILLDRPGPRTAFGVINRATNENTPPHPQIHYHTLAPQDKLFCCFCLLLRIVQPVCSTFYYY